MQEGRPSVTAMYVAFARAVATYDRTLSRVCDDRFAEHLLPHALGGFITATRDSASSDSVFAFLRESSIGFFDHLALRTRVIDDAVTQATAGGALQLVILGAGLDSRAHRLSVLRESTVFEVDFPSTQALKKRKASSLPHAAHDVRYAPCDFGNVPLRDALLAVGFDPARRSVWIWEGVTMYLEHDVVSASLAEIAALSAAASTLITTYVTHRRTIQFPQFAGLFTGLLSAVAEPILAMFSPEQLADELSESGFALHSDVLVRDAHARYHLTLSRFAFGMPTEHIAIAERRRALHSPEEQP